MKRNIKEGREGEEWAETGGSRFASTLHFWAFEDVIEPFSGLIWIFFVLFGLFLLFDYLLQVVNAVILDYLGYLL